MVMTEYLPLLKESINNIINPITYIINRSFECGVVPDEMKIAKVIPIFKSSDRNSITNYRPISLLTSFSKLLEKLMYDKMISFLLLNNSLFEHQYGFRAKHSTMHPSIHLLNHCAEAVTFGGYRFGGLILMVVLLWVLFTRCHLM